LESQATPLFAILPCEAVPETAGDFYATTKIARQSKGLGLDENDLWIASTALALGATLVTRDSDFANIDGLQVEDWSV
jgi:predicted nucleic acid-binding protein